MYARFDHAEAIAENIKTFWFEPEGRVRYIAGQFVEFYLLHKPHDGRGERRWFTLSSSPTESLISITTKFTAEGGSSFKQALLGIKPGTRVMLSEPMGDFVLPKDTSIPLIFVAGGIGVTPLRSMTKWLADKQEQRDIQLIYAARNSQEIAFKDLFTQRYGPACTFFAGRPITAEDILAAVTNKPDSLIYLAGPERMIELFVAALKQSGVAKHRIVTDYFPGYPSP